MYNNNINFIAGLAANNESSQFLYPALVWIIFQWGRCVSAGTNGIQTGQGLGHKTGETKLPICCFANSF